MKEILGIETFEKFMDMINNNNTYCNWVKEQNVKSYLQEIKKELLELELGIETLNIENIKEELADILYDAFVLAKLSEQEYGTSFNELFQRSIDKIKRRKPYIFENRSVSLEEASKLWQESKQKEKLK